MNDCVGLWTAEDRQCPYATSYITDNWRNGKDLIFLIPL